MRPLDLFIGFLSGTIVTSLLLYWWWRAKLRNRIWVSPHKPWLVKSIVELQPIVKNLLYVGKEGELLYVRFRHPEFLLRITKQEFKLSEDTVEVEIRSSSPNQDLYLTVRGSLSEAGAEYRERFTPKTRKPKDIRIRVEVGTFAPAAVANLLHIVSDAISADLSHGIQVSNYDPAYWPHAA